MPAKAEQHMAQNIYDRPEFFEGYSRLGRSVEGLGGAPEWPALRAMLPDVEGLSIVDLGCGFGWFCRWARSHGAREVLGLDLSESRTRWEEAVGHFEHALLIDEKNGVRTFVGHTQQEYGAMLLARDFAGDREKAYEMLDQAIATAEELGMKGVLEDAQALRSRK